MAVLHLLVVLLLYPDVSIGNEALSIQHGMFNSDQPKHKMTTNVRKIVLNVMSRNNMGQSSIFTDEVTQLKIKMNKTSEVVLFENKSNDVAYFGWYLFYKKQIQILKVIMAGEVELAEPAFQSMCFITPLEPKEVVKIHDMEIVFKMKKEATKISEKDLGKDNLIMELRADRHGIIELENELNHCSHDALIYTSLGTIKHLANGDKDLKERMMSSLRVLPTRNESAYPLCEEASVMWDLGCLCRTTACIPWYPCALKVCSEEKGGEDAFCGLSACQRCKQFEFFVERKAECFWNIKE